MRYDTRTKGSMLVGSTKEAVIAMHVSRNVVREWERGRDEEYKGQEVDEEMKAEDARFTLCCMDEGENIYVIKNAAHDRAQKKITSITG